MQKQNELLDGRGTKELAGKVRRKVKDLAQRVGTRDAGASGLISSTTWYVLRNTIWNEYQPPSQESSLATARYVLFPQTITCTHKRHEKEERSE